MIHQTVIQAGWVADISRWYVARVTATSNGAGSRAVSMGSGVQLSNQSQLDGWRVKHKQLGWAIDPQHPDLRTKVLILESEPQA
ncbi:hypothetical protein Cantr_07305 [Candida viswanathii]|uniref:Uncharacterized protein n=1 Tax=Candida viswanathii TaxID=5486 RepID=A0A367XZS0_9ASCO|nr:hypothetical protein Cantr_07305 [Candida viswanathii]